MSSLKFSVQKKQHRERAQPHSRRKWGLLEKHKDYVLRARDYHQKESRLKLLREKATSRNPDEFYHGMVNSKTDRRGIAQKERDTSVALTPDQVRLLKTQDEGYLVTMIQQEKAKVARLEQRLAFVAGAIAAPEPRESVEDLSDYDYSDLEEEEVKKPKAKKAKKRAQAGSRHVLFADSLAEAEAQAVKTAESAAPTKAQARLVRERQERQDRVKELEQVLQEVQLQRQLMANGPKKKVTRPDGSIVWKWKPQRKR